METDSQHKQDTNPTKKLTDWKNRCVENTLGPKVTTNKHLNFLTDIKSLTGSEEVTFHFSQGQSF